MMGVIRQGEWTCGGPIPAAQRRTLSNHVANCRLLTGHVFAPGMRDHVLPRCSFTGADREFSIRRIPRDDGHQQKLLIPFDQASHRHSLESGICGEQV